MNKEDHIEKQELREMAPTLSSLEKKTPYRVPADYFESLPNEIQNRIQTERKTQFTFRLLLRKSLITALGVALVAIIGWWMIDGDNPQIADSQLDWSNVEITEDDLLAIDDGLLFSYYEENFEEEESSFETDDDILEFLLDDSYPVEYLLDEL